MLMCILNSSCFHGNEVKKRIIIVVVVDFVGHSMKKLIPLFNIESRL